MLSTSMECSLITGFTYFKMGGKPSLAIRSDGVGLRKLDRLGIYSIVISTETNPVVSERCKKLNIRCCQGVEDKLALLNKVFLHGWIFHYPRPPSLVTTLMTLIA